MSDKPVYRMLPELSIAQGRARREDRAGQQRQYDGAGGSSRHGCRRDSCGEDVRSLPPVAGDYYVMLADDKAANRPGRPRSRVDITRYEPRRSRCRTRCQVPPSDVLWQLFLRGPTRERRPDVKVGTAD